MLTRFAVRNFKLFDEIELDLGRQVVLIGPNNAGKTTALQALALWDIGLKRWLEKRGAGDIPSKRPGVTVNRRDLIALPVPTANLLWRDLHTRTGRYENGKTRTQNVLVEVVVDGLGWTCGLEFDYANEESFYCRPLRRANGERMAVPEAARDVRVAYLPPMSGLAANETRLDPGAIHYVANQPSKAREHFHGVREAKPDLAGIAIHDRLESPLQDDPSLSQLMWRRCELESYLCRRDVLLDFAESEGLRYGGELDAVIWRSQMQDSIEEIEQALTVLGEPSPWGPDIKASDTFLDPLFKRFYERSGSPALIRKTDYHRLAGFLSVEAIDPEITEKLDAIADAASRARPRGG